MTPGNFIGAGFTGPGGTLFTGRYTTQLYSSELNWRHSLNDQVTFITGFRWIELSDEMDYRLTRPLPKATTNTATTFTAHNGPRLEAHRSLQPAANRRGRQSRPLWNEASGGIYEFQGAGRNFIGSFTGVTRHAFVGELDLTASYQLTCHMAVRGGYELLWLNDVAPPATPPPAAC